MRITIVTLALLSGAVFLSVENANAQGCPQRPEGDGAMYSGPQTSAQFRQAHRTKLPKRQEGDGTLHTVALAA
jgi:hypothetical protein